MKKTIITSILLVTILTGCGCNKKENEDNKKTNNEPSVNNPTNITNENMLKDQNVENLQFTNTAITYDGNMTKITSQVTNTSESEVTLSTVMAYITYKDEQDNEKTIEMSVYFGEKLKPGETRTAENSVDKDLRKSTNIEYKIVR